MVLGRGIVDFRGELVLEFDSCALQYFLGIFGKGDIPSSGGCLEYGKRFPSA